MTQGKRTELVRSPRRRALAEREPDDLVMRGLAEIGESDVEKPLQSLDLMMSRILVAISGLDGDHGTTVRRAADKGHAGAQFDLGAAYNRGAGVSEDPAAAAKWYRLAAYQGHANAQFRLGSMYRNGRGVPQDAREAVRWYRLAAEQGRRGAQVKLGAMYDTGRGVPRDASEAARWYRLAAEQGDATAQFNLGVMYATGRGVLQDYLAGHMWANLAGARGHEGARDLRDRIAKRYERAADCCRASGCPRVAGIPQLGEPRSGSLLEIAGLRRLPPEPVVGEHPLPFPIHVLKRRQARARPAGVVVDDKNRQGRELLLPAVLHDKGRRIALSPRRRPFRARPRDLRSCRGQALIHPLGRAG